MYRAKHGKFKYHKVVQRHYAAEANDHNSLWQI